VALVLALEEVMTFDDAFAALIGNEGVLSMDPRDRGNWTGGKVNAGILKGTKYGISAAAYPNLDIENLTLDQASVIYRHDYWAAAGCEIVPEELRFDLFDMAVNSGVGGAVRALQMAIGAVVDGKLGSETVMRAQSMNGHLVSRFNGARLKHITGMPPQEWIDEGKGLVNRIANNLLRG
jgi:lysozyme family protein